MSLDYQQRLLEIQRKQKEWDTIGAEWERRFKGELNDITPPEELSNSYTSSEGKKLFFLCDSAKVPVSDISSKKYKHRRTREMDRASVSTQKTGLGKSLSDSVELPRMSVIRKEDSQTLLARSFMKPTLKGDSFGPGDSHKRAMENYYHVQDSLPPEPLTGKEMRKAKSIMLYYDNSAPPCMPVMGSKDVLMDGVTGTVLPFPLVVDHRTAEEEVNFKTMPVKALKKQTGVVKKRVIVEGKIKYYDQQKEESKKTSSLFDSLLSGSGGGAESAGTLSSNSSIAGGGNNSNASLASSKTGRSRRSTTKKKALSKIEIEAGLEEMNGLLESLSPKKGGSTVSETHKAWGDAGLAIKNHFHLLNGGKKLQKDLYKDEDVGRFFKRFVSEGPRRGDGCFESDNREIAKLRLESILHKAKEHRRDLNVFNTTKPKKASLEERRILRDLRIRIKREERRLMKSEYWKLKNAKVNRVKDKRNFDSLWEDSSEEEEEVVEEEPPTREELWLADTNIDLFAEPEKKKPKTPEVVYEDRQIITEAMNILEETMMEYVYEFMGEELEEMERLGLIACAIDVQARFRGYAWRRDNFKIVNRLQMRAKSRAKKFRKKREEQGGVEGEGQGGVVAETEENAWAGAENVWIDPDTGATWDTLQDQESRAWYYQNRSTGETRWA
ncbi:hypothetical protein TrVE_jg2263 [Triparma verrucosa]|uniref:WW domain-containing protein n=1 Tax=Triparma verrucosa TaxID=1606542 RepID=A0A9W7FEI4_9STRA|nr:hypothetical protein TrVE_jg2263 [Triparma verrucosa]